MINPLQKIKIVFGALSISQRMAISILLVVLVLLLTFYSIFQVMLSDLGEYMIGQDKQILSLIITDIDSQVLSMQTVATTLLGNNFVKRYVSSPTPENRTSLQALMTRNAYVGISLGDSLYNNDMNVHDIFSLGNISGLVIASRYDTSYVSTGALPDKEICDRLVAYVQEYYSSDTSLPYISLPQELYDGIPGLCYVFPMANDPNISPISYTIHGYIIVFASRYHTLKNMAKYYDESLTILLEDDMGKSIWCSDELWSTPAVHAGTPKDAADTLSVSAQLSSVDWKVTLSTPMASVTSQLRTYWYMFALVVLTILVAYFLLIRSFSKSIYTRLKEMIRVITDVRDGNTDSRYPVIYRDEISQIGKEFNHMIDQLQKYHINFAMEELRRKEAELRALQAQINPHFLYNSLDCIRSAALVNHDTIVAKQIQTLANMLRYTVSGNISMEKVTISEEIDHIYDYLSMLSFRFEDRYSVNLQISDKILPLQSLKLILQPVVENAFTHGLRHMASGGTVLISGKLQNNCVVFRIEDNGCGIAPDRLQQLRQILAAHPLVDQNNPFMGLVNINDRIRLAYGNEYGVQVDSTLHHGTTVTIRIPIISTKGCE